MTDKQLIEEFPFLECQPENDWCYGNSDDINWFHNLPKGWEQLGLKMFSEIKDCLVKYNIPLECFIIQQLKEKWGELRLYWALKCPAKKECIKEIDDIVDKYEDVSYNTCIECGKQAKYVTLGYILPYCENCIKPNWKIKEINNEVQI